MRYDPLGSANANAGGSGVTGRHTRAAERRRSPMPPLTTGYPSAAGGARRGSVASRWTGFRGLSVSAGAMVLVIIAAIAVFLISKAIPALHADKSSFLTTKEWFPNDANPPFGIAALAFGTVSSSSSR